MSFFTLLGISRTIAVSPSQQPDRIKSIYNHMYQCGIIDKCVRCESRMATKDEILLVHAEDYYESLRATQGEDLFLFLFLF